MKSDSIFAKLFADKERRAPSQAAPGGGRAAKSTSSGVRRMGVSSSKVDGPPTKKHSKTYSANDRPVGDFSHLLTAPMLDDGIDASREVFAAAVVAAADKTRAPAVAPKPVGLAKQILAAGDKARKPTGTGAAKPDGLAAKIVAAGKKARGMAQ